MSLIVSLFTWVVIILDSVTVRSTVTLTAV